LGYALKAVLEQRHLLPRLNIGLFISVRQTPQSKFGFIA
jgi:hypothetical protein